MINPSCTTASTSAFFFFSSRRRHTRLTCDWSSDVCSSDLVARLADDVRKGAFPLALSDHGLIGGGDARGETAGAANLRVRPGYIVGCAQIRTVGDIHAARRTDQDRIVARRFTRHPVLDRGAATGTGAVTGDERLGRRQFRVVKTRPLIRTVEKRQQLPLNFNCCHIRSSRWRALGPRINTVPLLFESDPMRTFLDLTAFLRFQHLLRHPVEFLQYDRLAAHPRHERENERTLLTFIESRADLRVERAAAAHT